MAEVEILYLFQALDEVQMEIKGLAECCDKWENFLLTNFVLLSTFLSDLVQHVIFPHLEYQRL